MRALSEPLDGHMADKEQKYGRNRLYDVGTFCPRDIYR